MSIISVMQSSQTRIIMRFLNLLLYAGLIFVTTTSCKAIGNNSSETVDYCLSSNIIPMHYDINLITNIEETNFSLSGESNISIMICSTILNISLHPLDYKINETATTLIDNKGTIYKPTGHNYETSITILTFDNALSSGFYTLYVKYVTDIQEDDTFKMLYSDEEGYRVWFALMPFVTVSIEQKPLCYNHPELKPTFNISVKHHQKYRALSNMPLREQHTDEDNMIWSHFNTTPPMPICRITVVVLNFVRVPNVNETVNMWCRSNLTSRVRFAQSIAEKIAEYMAQYTNISNKIPKTDHIAVPSYFIRGIGNWGLITYEEYFITYDTERRYLFHKRRVAELVAHEMIHQWFGNLVSSSSPHYKWLSEGFASFLQAYILNKIYENWRVMDFLVIENLHGSLLTDTSLIMNFLESGRDNRRKTIDYFDYLGYTEMIYSLFYDKAPVILRMLQHVITDEVFREGVRIYLRTNQFRSIKTDDLWIAMQSALNKSDVPHNHFNIKEVMDTWVEQKHYPLVTVTRNYETGETILSQEHFHLREDKKNNVTDDAKWWIPVTFTTQTNLDFNNTLPDYWLRPNKNISLEINPNDWIIVNLQQTGYYRVNYDTTNWRRIANYLNSEEYMKIHVLNRAQLIDDAYNLMIEKQLDSSIFLNLTRYLSRETDIVAWYPMFEIFSRLSQYFPLPESKTFKSQMAGTFNKLLENVGHEEDQNINDLMALKRMQALRWACMLGNLACQRMAIIKLNEYLADPDNHKLSPLWQKWTYCAGLKVANMTTWNKVMSLYMRNHTRILLEYLACSKDPNIIINYLNIISSNNSVIQEEERKFAFNYIVKRNARNDLVLDYMLQNLERIKPRSITINNALKNIVVNIFSKMQVDKVKEFIKNNINIESSAAIQRVVEDRWVKLKNLKGNFSELFIRGNQN